MSDATVLMAKAEFCRFLAACYYQPAPEFSEEKLFDSMRTAADPFDAELAGGATRLCQHFECEGVERLLVDYTRLFLGPSEILAKPYGSFWLTGEKTLMQQATVDVLDLYERAGFEIDESFKELPDHVAAELEFLYLLIHKEAAVQQSDDLQALRSTLDLRKRFLAAHLGRWIKPFALAVKTHAQTAFYRELADLTARFVQLEIGREGA
jgi:TorA maturation chaperone TorD